MKGARTENRGTVASRYSFILLPVQKNEESNSQGSRENKKRQEEKNISFVGGCPECVLSGD